MNDWNRPRYSNRPRYNNRNWNVIALAPFVITALVVVLFAVVGISSRYTTDVYTNCTVTDKDRTSNSDGQSSMRIYTTCGVFEVRDTIIGDVDFNSADKYAAIEEGKTYNFETRGERVGLLSWFPVIMDYQEV